MSAWMRFGWGILVLGGVLGSTTQAGLITPASLNGNSFSGYGFSRANQTTSFTSWAPNSWSTPTPSSYQIPTHTAAPPGPAISPILAAAPVSVTPASITPIAAPYIPPAAPVMAPVVVNPPVAIAAAQVIPAVPASTAPTVANAFVNLGNGPYPDAGAITSGNAQPWFNSQNPTFLSLFGGNPTAQQEAAFSAAVFQRVEQTFSLSGVNVALTTDPNALAAHTLSLVSNTSASILPAAIGMTYVGGNGFSFVDQQVPAAQSLDQLEWITAHNIAHELMLAFGVGENYDTSGAFIDARNAQWTMLTNPSATFSAAAAAALNQALANTSNNTAASPSAQVVDAQPVPEPTTLGVWTLIMTAALMSRSRRWGESS